MVYNAKDEIFFKWILEFVIELRMQGGIIEQQVFP